MRRLSFAAVLLAVLLVPASFALASIARDNARRALDRALASEATQQRESLDAYFERARAVILLTGNMPAFRQFYETAGSRRTKIAADAREISNVKEALVYLERLYPGSIGEACFIDRSGPENARAVRGRLAPIAELSADESAQPFFAPAFELSEGQVHQARPYVSPDTGEWVIANATPIPGARRARAIVHFEVTIESFRRDAASRSSRFPIKVIDARTGAVVIDSRTPQRRGARLGAPGDRRFTALRRSAAKAGVIEAGGRRVAYERVRGGTGNANDWLVVAVAPAASGSLLSFFGAGSIGMIVASALLLAFALVGARAGSLRSEANTDDLTGLANRRYFLRRLSSALRTAAREERSVGLLMIDLDRFKELNDTLGHHVGDRLLEQFGPRLRQAVRGADTLARLGGDEFAVLITELADQDAARDVADRIQGLLEEPFILDGMAVQVDASVGIAVFPDHGERTTELLQRADVAMYQAKHEHTGTEIYSAERDGHSRERLALAGELRSALRARELVLHYQPKADLGTGRIVGVEALVRWQHPRHGMLAPDRFLAVAEQAGLMRQLTAYVLDEALRQAAAWGAAGRGLDMAVNVCAADLLDNRFPDEVHALLARHAVPAERLQLEVTENTVMSDPQRILDVLARLSEAGIALSLDDYGTGYSSLAYLKRLPIRELKIDRSFVCNMDTDDQDATIVRSTVELANNLHLRVVAEGVETNANWTALADMGAQLAQGYLLTAPLPASDFDAWIETWTHRPARPADPLHT